MPPGSSIDAQSSAAAVVPPMVRQAAQSHHIGKSPELSTQPAPQAASGATLFSQRPRQLIIPMVVGRGVGADALYDVEFIRAEAQGIFQAQYSPLGIGRAGL